MKTSPIGVRFDIDKLEKLKGGHNLSTPQQVVNFLFDTYFGRYYQVVEFNEMLLTQKEGIDKYVELVNKEPKQVKVVVKQHSVTSDLDRLPGEGAIDYAIRKAEITDMLP